jgi:hypothetical protein
MFNVKIDSFICTPKGNTLVVFYTYEKGWQFRLISYTGSIFGLQRIYYTPEEALKAGREWLGNESDIKPLLE